MITAGKTERRARIGVISDTHGYLHPAVPEVFQPVKRVIHAGDIGGPGILTKLGRLAPVTAVRGNMDTGAWAAALPDFDIVEFENMRICVLHDRQRLDFDPQLSGLNAVISGHTHRPRVRTEDGVLFVNPGSASHPRHRQTPTVALLEVANGIFSVRFVELVSETTGCPPKA